MRKPTHLSKLLLLATMITPLFTMEPPIKKQKTIGKSKRRRIDHKKTITLKAHPSEIEGRLSQFMTNDSFPNNPIKLKLLQLYPSYANFKNIVNLAHKYHICSRIIGLHELSWGVGEPAQIPKKLVALNPITQKPYFENLQELTITDPTNQIPLEDLTILANQLQTLSFYYGDWPTIASFLQQTNPTTGKSVFTNLKKLRLPNTDAFKHPETLHSLNQLPSLKTIDFRDNLYEPHEKKQLQTIFPDKTILFDSQEKIELAKAEFYENMDLKMADLDEQLV